MEIENEKDKKILIIDGLDKENEIYLEIQETDFNGNQLAILLNIDQTQKLIDFLQNQLDDFNTKNNII